MISDKSLDFYLQTFGTSDYVEGSELCNKITTIMSGALSFNNIYGLYEEFPQVKNYVVKTLVCFMYHNDKLFELRKCYLEKPNRTREIFFSEVADIVKKILEEKEHVAIDGLCAIKKDYVQLKLQEYVKKVHAEIKLLCETDICKSM